MENRVSVLFLSVQAIVSMKMGLSKKGVGMSCCPETPFKASFFY